MSCQKWQRNMKLTLPGGCHHNPDPLLNIIHIRKILPYYLNNNGGGFPVVVSCIKLSAKLCHHQKCTHLKGYREEIGWICSYMNGDTSSITYT